MHSHDPRRRKRSDAKDEMGALTEPDPMEEENFPDSPARRSADREMNEPANIPGMVPRLPKRPPVREDDE